MQQAKIRIEDADNSGGSIVYVSLVCAVAALGEGKFKIEGEWI